VSEVGVYYGVASGQQRAALRRLEPENLMISYATQNNHPLVDDPRKRPHKLFVDSGGFHHMMTNQGEYEDTDTQYLDYIQQYAPDLWALRDYPCEAELLAELGETVEERQQKTTNHHVALTNKMDDRGRMPGTAVSVVQGWTQEQYMEHLDALQDHGVLHDYVGIGTVCGREDTQEVANIIFAVRDALPSRCRLHAFGVKGDVLRYEEVVDALDSADSAAYDWKASNHFEERADGQSFTWRDCARAYLNWRHNLMRQMGSETIRGGTQQTTLGVAYND